MVDSDPQPQAGSRPQRMRRPAPNPEMRITPLTDPSRIQVHSSLANETLETQSSSEDIPNSEENGESDRGNGEEGTSLFTAGNDGSGASEPY